MPKSVDGCASKAQGAQLLHCTLAAQLRGLYQLSSSWETVTASSMLWEVQREAAIPPDMRRSGETGMKA